MPTILNLTKHYWSVQSKIWVCLDLLDSFDIMPGDESPYYKPVYLQFKSGQTNGFLPLNILMCYVCEFDLKVSFISYPNVRRTSSYNFLSIL